MRHLQHILGAATNILGVPLILITALNLTHRESATYSDEIAWLSVFLFLAATTSSYFALRHEDDARLSDRLAGLADRAFITGILSLILSVGVLVFAKAI